MAQRRVIRSKRFSLLIMITVIDRWQVLSHLINLLVPILPVRMYAPLNEQASCSTCEVISLSDSQSIQRKKIL